MPKVPNTISDAEMERLHRQASKANPDWFSGKAIKQRLNAEAQKRKADRS